MKEEKYLKKLNDKNKNLYQESVRLIEAGKKKEAKKKLSRLINREKPFIPAMNKMAVIYIYNNDYDKAQNLLNRILKRDSEFAPSVTNLGSIAKEKGNFTKAKELYKRALSIDKEYGPAYNNLGVIYKEEGNISKSVKYLKKARKNGSYSYQFNLDKPFYKDPGCLFVLFLMFVLIFVLYLILT